MYRVRFICMVTRQQRHPSWGHTIRSFAQVKITVARFGRSWNISVTQNQNETLMSNRSLMGSSISFSLLLITSSLQQSENSDLETSLEVEIKKFYYFIHCRLRHLKVVFFSCGSTFTILSWVGTIHDGRKPRLMKDHDLKSINPLIALQPSWRHSKACFLMEYQPGPNLLVLTSSVYLGSAHNGCCKPRSLLTSFFPLYWMLLSKACFSRLR